MSSNKLLIFAAGVLVWPLWPVIRAILHGIAVVIASLSCAINTALSTPSPQIAIPAVTQPVPQAPQPGTDPALLKMLANQSEAITKMAESQQSTTEALRQNTAVLQQLITQPRPAPTTTPTSCAGCGRGEYLEIPPPR